MTLAEQGTLVEMWHAYLGGAALAEHARNVDMVSFYFDIVRDSPLYQFGGYIEMFDVLVNGPFDPESVSSDHYGKPSELKSDAA